MAPSNRAPCLACAFPLPVVFVPRIRAHTNKHQMKTNFIESLMNLISWLRFSSIYHSPSLFFFVSPFHFSLYHKLKQSTSKHFPPSFLHQGFLSPRWNKKSLKRNSCSICPSLCLCLWNYQISWTRKSKNCSHLQSRFITKFWKANYRIPYIFRVRVWHNLERKTTGRQSWSIYLTSAWKRRNHALPMVYTETCTKN